MIGSAGAFNLQAHAAAVAVQAATGSHRRAAPDRAARGGLRGVRDGAAAGTHRRWEIGPRTGAGRTTLLTVGIGTLGVVGLGTALLPHTLSCVLFFGFAVPAAGLVVLPQRIRHGATAERRTQARLLFSVLLAALGTSCVLVCSPCC